MGHVPFVAFKVWKLGVEVGVLKLSVAEHLRAHACSEIGVFNGGLVRFLRAYIICLYIARAMVLYLFIPSNSKCDYNNCFLA